jgi:pantoate--beta-alanine ligase
MQKNKIKVLADIKSVREQISHWKKQGLKIGFVPTMGALHNGHASLIQKAKGTCDKVVVSIFVNPAQFGPNEDFYKYPKPIEKDIELCSKYNVDLVFNPTVEVMYPEKQEITKICPPANFKNKLCGIARDGHFDGVATVVIKLFNIINPDYAFFGEKDAQQLLIIKKICRDLNLPVEIIGCPTVRESEGLALSSRNIYLSENARNQAATIYKVLEEALRLYNEGLTDKKEIVQKSLIKLSRIIKIEYFEAYSVINMDPVEIITPGTLLAFAGKIGGVRLIDNIIIR